MSSVFTILQVWQFPPSSSVCTLQSTFVLVKGENTGLAWNTRNIVCACVCVWPKPSLTSFIHCRYCYAWQQNPIINPYFKPFHSKTVKHTTWLDNSSAAPVWPESSVCVISVCVWRARTQHRFRKTRKTQLSNPKKKKEQDYIQFQLNKDIMCVSENIMKEILILLCTFLQHLGFRNNSWYFKDDKLAVILFLHCSLNYNNPSLGIQQALFLHIIPNYIFISNVL